MGNEHRAWGCDADRGSCSGCPTMMTAVQRSRSEGASDLAVRRRLSWRAPIANGDKLLSFKLMLTNMDGRARVGVAAQGETQAILSAHMQAGRYTALELPPAPPLSIHPLLLLLLLLLLLHALHARCRRRTRGQRRGARSQAWPRQPVHLLCEGAV